MNVRAFTESDLPEFNRWLALRGMLPVEYRDVGGDGFVVDGVAAGFIIETFTSRVFLEPLITNPERSAAERSEALDLVIVALVGRVRRWCGNGVHRTITALVSEDAPALIARGERLGFVRANLPAHVVLTKELT